MWSFTLIYNCNCNNKLKYEKSKLKKYIYLMKIDKNKYEIRKEAKFKNETEISNANK